jgi:hypothetical protein
MGYQPCKRLIRARSKLSTRRIRSRYEVGGPGSNRCLRLIHGQSQSLTIEGPCRKWKREELPEWNTHGTTKQFLSAEAKGLRALWGTRNSFGPAPQGMSP